MQLTVWMQQIPSLIFFVHRMLTENSSLSDSIANVTANERNNLQYWRQLFLRYKSGINVYTSGSQTFWLAEPFFRINFYGGAPCLPYVLQVNGV